MTKKIILFFILAFVFRVFFSFIVWHPDLKNHMDWGTRFWEYGASKIYAPESNVWSYTWPNQPPGTMIMFAGIRKLFDALFGFFWMINVNIPAFPSVIISFFETNLYPALLKLPGIVADMGIAYLIFTIIEKIRDKRSAVMGSLIFLINPVIWYNSSVWGQYDSVINFFALLSFHLLYKRKIALSLMFFCLSIYIKASLLIFAPIWIVYALIQRFKSIDWIKSLALTLLVIGIITLPFSRGEPFSWLYDIYVKKVFVQQLHIITANAFNLWAFIAGIHERPDSLPFLGFDFKTWGSILFAVFYAPTLYLVYKRKDFSSVILSLSVAAFSSFMLLTNMHERYLYPLFPYLTILLPLPNIYPIYYWVVSLVGLLNLYNFWWVPKIPMIQSFLSFNDRIMPRVFGLLMFILFLQFYTRHFLRSLLPQKVKG